MCAINTLKEYEKGEKISADDNYLLKQGNRYEMHYFNDRGNDANRNASIC
jgi:hypothetical protein